MCSSDLVADDAVVLYQEGPARWVVFYAERGDRIGEKVYDSEDAVCQALIKEARFLRLIPASIGRQTA